MLLIKLYFSSLLLIILVGCNQSWNYNEKLIFMEACPDSRNHCECQYQIAYKNFTYKEFKSILDKKASQRVKNRVNSVKDLFLECYN